MLKFIESIRLEDGKIFHLDLHQRRADLTMLAHFGRSIQHNLEATFFNENLPSAGLHKIRVTYGVQIERIDIEPYVRRAIRRIELVAAANLDYRYKYADRAPLMALRSDLSEGVEPVIVRDGLVADALYANVCLLDGERWLTPERPLLMGVAREVAIRAGEILPAQILASDVRAGKYAKVKLINCMNWFQESPEIILLSPA